MAAYPFPTPVWDTSGKRSIFHEQLGRAATMAWATAAIYILDESASAISKRLAAPDSAPGSNSKYLYQLKSGKHVLSSKGGGRYGYNWLAAVAERPRGDRVTRFYYEPWELMEREISLDRVSELLHATVLSLCGPNSVCFFYVAEEGFPSTPAWWRKRSSLHDEIRALDAGVKSAMSAVKGCSDAEFDRFVAFWCLYREAMLRRELKRAVYYRLAVVDAGKKIASHPVFSQVFANEYDRLFKQVLEEDGLPPIRDIYLRKVRGFAERNVLPFFGSARDSARMGLRAILKQVLKKARSRG
ncbi:hypothetical protein AB4Y36_34765 [Paraburkholderia sp. BR10936]|uniref:hypothetical protein n=1 Tax=Paraburkholderia sp. BR10936 TaxID=3236993 RepID=UPI0034D25425